MDTDIENRLERIEKMVEDNSRMLIKMRRAQKRASAARALYWVVIIAISVAAYYYVQPYVKSISDQVTSVKNSYDSVSGFFSGNTKK